MRKCTYLYLVCDFTVFNIYLIARNTIYVIHKYKYNYKNINININISSVFPAKPQGFYSFEVHVIF